MVEIIKENVRDFNGSAVLVRKDGKYFIVSSVHAYSGFETLVFRSDEKGNVTDWGDLAGGRGRSREEAIEELDSLELNHE